MNDNARNARLAGAGNWTTHKSRVAADFGAAANGYDQAARLQKEVVSILAQRLVGAPLELETILDLGCGTGLALQRLASRFPGARIIGLDLAEGMVRHARARQHSHFPERKSRDDTRAGWLVGDAEALPLASASLDLIFSSLAIQWCENTPAMFGELARVLKPGGGLVVSTLVAGTLDELRSAWREADPGREHVNRFLSLEALTRDVRRVLPNARVETVFLRLLYPDVLSLLRELKALGARYKDGPRRQAATAPARLRRLGEAYRHHYVNDEGMLPATYQVAIITL